MICAVRFASLTVGLALALTSCASGSQHPIVTDTPTPGPDSTAPACLVEMVEQQPRPGAPTIPAPDVSPERGTAGTTVTVSGTNMASGDGVMIVAFFGSENCALPEGGRGDHLLSFTTAAQDGTYRATVEWPRLFDPVEGRGLPEGGVELPAGRYFFIALPCPSLDRSCFEDFSLGSAIGGPFTSLES